MIVQGFDAIKEWMTPMMRMADERGLASLAVDLPGHGESLLRGVPLGNTNDAVELGRSICELLCEHPRIRNKGIGLFGLSLGGFAAVVMAGAVPRFGACATLGAPFDFGFLDRSNPIMLRRASFATGFDSVDMVRRSVEGIDLRHFLPEMAGPLLVVHGEDDEIVPVRHAELIHHYATCPKSFEIFERADHMVSDVLMTEALPVVFDWLGDALVGPRIERMRPDFTAGRKQ